MPDAALLSVDQLTAGYGGPPIIDSVSLQARANELTAIVGPNGAGKSTLLKAIAGTIRPTGGHVYLDGSDITGMRPEKLVRLGISYVPQVANVFPSLTVHENMEMGGYARSRGTRERAEELYEMFPDLKLAARRPARTLSGGQRNMLAIARGLMLDPRVMLLDEPSAGLSPRFELVVWEHVLRVRATGVAVVIVEQNTRRTLSHANRGYVMTQGKNRLEGTGADLLNDQEVAALYIGGAVDDGSQHQNGSSGGGRSGG